MDVKVPQSRKARRALLVPSHSALSAAAKIRLPPTGASKSSRVVVTSLVNGDWTRSACSAPRSRRSSRQV